MAAAAVGTYARAGVHMVGGARKSRISTTVLALMLLTGAPALMAIGPAVAAAAPTTWPQQPSLTAPDAAAGDAFGKVMIAGFGTTAVVGANDKALAGNPGAGAAYVFVKDAGTWTFQAELTASDAAAGDAFGTSLSITKDGSTIVVGAPNKTVAGKTDAGTAYVFTRVGTTWTQTAELTAAQVGTGNGFGETVAINGIATRIAVAAPARSVANQLRAGALYVFTRAGSAWNPDAILTEPEPQQDDFFGTAIVAKETQVLASSPFHANSDGTSGVVYGFDDPDGPYVQKTVLTAGHGNRRDAFGSSLSLSGAVMVVGAPEHKVGTQRTGAVYVFTHSDRTGIWTPRVVLAPSDGAPVDKFGTSVAISGTTLVIGDPFHRVGANPAQGVAYVFTGAGAGWTQRAELTPSDGAAHTSFGRWVATSDTSVMGGDPNHPVGTLAGAGIVDVFEAS